MNDHTESSKAQGTAPASGSDIEAVRRNARRRLLKGGLSAAPVVLTVTSRPVLAGGGGGGGGTCHGPTGFHSANLSREVGETPCNWPKPNDWCKDNCNDWPSSCKTYKTQKFTDVFGCKDSQGHIKSDYKDYSTCWDVIRSNNSADSVVIGKLLMASLLNCRQYGLKYPMTEAQVKEIWLEHNNGGFRPGSDTQAWDAAKVKKYLWYTMGVATFG
jgi:hypothetical protein